MRIKKNTVARKAVQNWQKKKFLCILIPQTQTILTFWKAAAEDLILNLVNLNQIKIVITLFRLLWYLTWFRLLSYQSEKCNYNLELTNFRKIFRCVGISQQICHREIGQFQQVPPWRIPYPFLFPIYPLFIQPLPFSLLFLLNSSQRIADRE